MKYETADYKKAVKFADEFNCKHKWLLKALAKAEHKELETERRKEENDGSEMS